MVISLKPKLLIYITKVGGWHSLTVIRLYNLSKNLAVNARGWFQLQEFIIFIQLQNLIYIPQGLRLTFLLLDRR